jgi:hypothetical protein
MLHSLKLARPLLAAAAIFWGVAIGTPANAILITPDSNAGNTDLVTITGDGSFVGLTQTNGVQFLAGTSSFTDAFGFLSGPGSPAQEAALFTTVCDCGTTFTAAGKDDFPSSSYVVNTEFFSIKQDGWIAFFHNLTGGTLNVDLFLGNCLTEECSPLQVSHATYFVPVPAVGAGLPGLVLACGGLLALARRRRQLVA